MKTMAGRMKPAALCFVLLLLCSAGFADPVLPGIFSDHMVLQRGRALPVWGWADPEEKVAVSLNGATAETIAGHDRRWKVMLPAMQAGGPFLLTVSGKKSIALKDVMIGEVWVLSGQSNMTFALSGADNAASEIAAADLPEIRLFTVPEKRTLDPQQNVEAAWQTCTPDTAKGFSAVGYFFGRDLYRALHVPIGLIHSSWPGTPGEDWTSPASLAHDPQMGPILERWKNAGAESKRLAAQAAEFDLEFDDFALLKKQGGEESLSDFNDGNSRNARAGLWTYDWKSGPQTSFALVQPGRGGSGYAAKVSGRLESQDDGMLRTSYSGDGSPVDISQYAGVRFFVRGNGSFRLRSLQPSIYDWDDYGTAAMTATPDWKPVTIWFKDLEQEGWGIPTPFTANSLSGLAIQVVQSAGTVTAAPSGLFNGMIAPLLPYAIRGAVWYQGESNAPRAYQYRSLLADLITGWRDAWGEGDFPFLVVQLPNYGGGKERPSESAWAEMREAELMALRLPNTGVAVTMGLGEAENIHPHHKAEVGERLALWALGTTYGRDIVYSGPLYDAMKVEGNQVRLQFRHVGSGLQAHGGGTLVGFAVAGADHVFHWADAKIDGDAVVVSSSAVPSPLAVRYAWGDNPDCNLYNREGLPASPFRTDDWQGITQKEK